MQYEGGYIGTRPAWSGNYRPGLWTPQYTYQRQRSGLWFKTKDPYTDNVVLFLKGDGTDGSTNIVDSSLATKTVSVFGTSAISTAQSKYGGSSILLARSTSNYLTVTPSDDFVFPGDFTIEGWFRWDGVETSNGCHFLGTGGAGTLDQFGVFSGNFLAYPVSFAGSSVGIITNTWTHLATCRSGSSCRLFKNGVQIGNTVTYSTSLGRNNVSMFIGKRSDDRHPYGGYIDSLRITKGIARYTTNFNPETDTYLRD